jgi:hypothetical protein
MKGQKQPRRLAQTPLGAVALDRPADLAGGGEAGRHAGALRLGQGLDHHSAARARGPARGGQEFGPALQARDDGALGWAEVRQGRTLQVLSGQPLAALGAATGQHLAAVLGGHAQAETVAALTHEAARLIGALHEESSAEK